MLHSCLREMNVNVEMSTWMELIISNLIKICFLVTSNNTVPFNKENGMFIHVNTVQHNTGGGERKKKDKTFLL